MWAQLVSVFVGVWLMAAPAAWGYDASAGAGDRIVGPLVAAFAAAAVWEVTRPLRRVNTVLGAWLLIAPWILAAPWSGVFNDMTCGMALILLSLVRGSLSWRFGGGWSALRSDPDAPPAH